MNGTSVRVMRPAMGICGIAAGVLAALIGGAPAVAQCDNYAAVRSGGVVINPGVTNVGNVCDDCVTSITLPFAVSLYGQSYTTVGASSNGNLQFGSANRSFTNACLPTNIAGGAALGPTIFALWDDLRTDVGANGIYTGMVGTAPNRVFEIEWRASFFNGGGPANFQVRLFEGQSQFEIIYGNIAAAVSATIGVQGGGSSGFTQFACNQADLQLTAGTKLTFACAARRFTYQGKLNDSAGPAQGSFDMQFAFFDTPASGTLLATVSVPGVLVDSAGLFSVPLDVPGLPSDGRPIFLEARVGGVVLSPRQQMTAAPTAAFAFEAGMADGATRAQGLMGPAGNDVVSVTPDGTVAVTGGLNAAGVMRASSFEIQGGAERVLSIPAAGFGPVSSDVNYNRGNGSISGTTSGTAAVFVAPVNLPDGATISNVTLNYVHNAAPTMTFYLLSVSNVTGALGFLGVVQSPAVVSATPQVVTVATNAVVNNSQFSYFLSADWLTPTGSTANVRMISAQVRYRVTGVP